MVSLVWWILSLCNVCAFSWLPIFIEGIVLVFVAAFFGKNESTTSSVQALSMGFALFAFCKCFLDLSISSWWILISPLWFALAALIPGGFTINNLLFSHFGLMNLPTWVLVVGIISDILFIGVLIVAIKQAKESQTP